MSAAPALWKAGVPYQSEEYRTYNQRRMRRYRRGPYGSAESERDVWRHASEEVRQDYVKGELYEADGTPIEHPLEWYEEHLRLGLAQFFGEEEEN